jgi:hypothetical protein
MHECMYACMYDNRSGQRQSRSARGVVLASGAGDRDGQCGGALSRDRERVGASGVEAQALDNVKNAEDWLVIELGYHVTRTQSRMFTRRPSSHLFIHTHTYSIYTHTHTHDTSTAFVCLLDAG